MLHEFLLDRSPVWLLYPATVLLLLFGNAIGFRVGDRRRQNMPEGERAPATAIVGSTLGLLAFMLAFTFGMSGSRFDARRQLVLDEASAVLRTHQRARMLPEPQRSACRKLLADYVDLRLHAGSLHRLAEIEPLLLRSEGIQDALWAEAASLSERPSPILAAFMQSLTELSDVQMRRVRAAVWNRLPRTILVTLYGIAFLALAAMGYGAGIAGSRTTVPSAALILVFAAIIVLIVDLERPLQDLFSVSQEPMADVARRIRGPAI